MSNVKHISLLSTLLRETTLRNMGLGEKEFYKLLNGLDWMPASYENIANCLMENGVKKMYHAIINEDDIPTLFTIPNLKIFWCCRCHLVAKDESTAHEHLHALVPYTRGTHRQNFSVQTTYINSNFCCYKYLNLLIIEIFSNKCCYCYILCRA